jgi:hypothetical protein
MDENKTVETVKAEKNWFQKTKTKVASGLNSFAEFVSKNQAMILPMVSMLGSMAFKGLTMLAGANQNDRCLSEDDVTGEEFMLKHPLRNDEILELGSRMVDGETKGEALNDMGLLRKERRRK